jgi:pimeloyl-ACP methyl ester carboxylesterase
MASIRVGRANSTPIELHYDDLGSGDLVVLLHGWPLDSRSWNRRCRRSSTQGIG